MKRAQNLQDLSRDHHHALVLARSAERAASSDRDEEIAMAWELIESKYEKELAPHFEVEESHILRHLEDASRCQCIRARHNVRRPRCGQSLRA